MPSSKLASAMRGFLLPDQRFTRAALSEGSSSYTEAGARPAGVGIPSDPSSRLVVASSGDQSDDLVVEVTQAGMPGTRSPVRVGYRLDSEGDDALRGWNAPNLVTRWTTPGFSNLATRLDAVTLEDQRVLVCVNLGITLTVLHVFDPTTDAWTFVSYFPTQTSLAFAMCPIPGRLLAISSIDDVWTVFHSEDQGVTWSPWARDMISQPLAAVRARLLPLPGGELVYMHFTAGTAYQYASNSLGTTFALVSTWVHGSATCVADAAVTASGKLAAVALDAAGDPYFYIVGSAYEPLDGALVIQVSALVPYDEVWLHVDPGGPLYIYGRRAGTDRIRVFRSTDDGATWTAMAYSVLSNGDADTYITGGKVVHAAGMAWMLHQFVDSVSVYQASACLLGLGGYSTVTANPDPAFVSLGVEEARVAYGPSITARGHVWIPISEPDDGAAWTAAGTATDAADSINATGFLTVTTAGTSRYYQAASAPASTTAELVLDVRVTAGGALDQAEAGAGLRLSDGVNATEVSICATATGFRVRDPVAGVGLGTVTADMTEWMQIKVLLDMTGNRLEVYWRRPYDAVWTPAAQGTIPPTTVSAATHLRWGNIIVGTATSVWRLVAYVEGMPSRWWGASASNDAVVDRTLVAGRGLSGLPVPILERATTGAGTTYLRATDGPGRVGESHALPVAADYPVDAIHHAIQPSPRVTWRTTTDAADATVAWLPDAGNLTSIGRSVGFAVLRANVRTVNLQGKAGGGAWTTIAALDLATGFVGLTYARGGNVLRPTGATIAAGRYVWRNELVGATVDLGGGKLRRIRSHTEGLWSTASGKRVELILEGIDGTEPATGTCTIIHTAGYVVAHGISAIYDRYRLQIPAQSTADGFFEVGIVLPGAVQAIGQEHGWGWSHLFEPNADTITSRDGVTRTRANGPVVGQWQWSWADGVDLSRLRGAAPTPDWLGDDAATVQGIANRNDVPYLLSGLLDELRSGEVPVLALASISGASGVTVTDPTLFRYVRLASSVSVENVMGDEGVDEVVRVSTVTMREIP